MFEGIYAHGSVAAELSDEAWVRAMCSAEAALAMALAQLGRIPDEAAAEVVAACERATALDRARLERSLAEHATPVIGLVAALRDDLEPELRAQVHAGATSQDIVDTAMMRVGHCALRPLLADCKRAADAAAQLAAAHRDTPMIGRTLMQQALPTTFGLRAAGWLWGLDAARARLQGIRDVGLPVQMGGPVGAGDPAVASEVAAVLGLADPVLGWAAIRVPVAELAAALGVLSGIVAKLARDVTLLSADEVAEVREGGLDGERGRSSAMSHKRNPVAAVSALACAKRVPGLVATLLATMESEHERAAGAWQAEWGTLAQLLGLAGSAIAWAAELLDGLEVDAGRMAANLRGAAAGAQPLPPDAGALVDRALAAHRTLASTRDQGARQ
jgi:3-carboxy-cis,cis-muconate cycloisomerase